MVVVSPAKAVKLPPENAATINASKNTTVRFPQSDFFPLILYSPMCQTDYLFYYNTTSSTFKIIYEFFVFFSFFLP
jgi:hypothetical protein